MRRALFSTSAAALLCLTPLAALAADPAAKPTTATPAPKPQTAPGQYQTPAGTTQTPAGTTQTPANTTTGATTTTTTTTSFDGWTTFKQGAREAWEKTANTFDDMTRRTQTDIVLPRALPGSLSARKLIGTPIENAREGRVGSVSDLVLGNDGRVQAVVVSDGGFLGIGTSEIPVQPRLISVRRDKDGNLKARTNVTERQLDAAYYAAFTTRIEAMNESFKRDDVRSASKILGATVADPQGRSIATVNDVLLSPVGEARYALLSTGGAMGVGSKVVAVPMTSLTFTRAGQPMRTTLSADQLNRLAAVRTS